MAVRHFRSIVSTNCNRSSASSRSQELEYHRCPKFSLFSPSRSSLATLPAGRRKSDHRAGRETDGAGRRIRIHRRPGRRRPGQRLLHRSAQRSDHEVEHRRQAHHLHEAVRAVQRPLLRRPGQPLGLRRRKERDVADRPGGQGHRRDQRLPGQAAQRAQRRLAAARRRAVFHRSRITSGRIGSAGRRRWRSRGSTTWRRTARS